MLSAEFAGWYVRDPDRSAAPPIGMVEVARMPRPVGVVKEIDGSIMCRPGCDVTLPAPIFVSLLATVGGDERVVDAHDRVTGKPLAWIEAAPSGRGARPDNGGHEPGRGPEDGLGHVPARYPAYGRQT